MKSKCDECRYEETRNEGFHDYCKQGNCIHCNAKELMNGDCGDFKEKCKYCKFPIWGNEKSKSLVEGRHSHVFISKSEIWIAEENQANEYDCSGEKINYCPMCGKDLKEDN